MGWQAGDMGGGGGEGGKVGGGVRQGRRGEGGGKEVGLAGRRGEGLRWWGQARGQLRREVEAGGGGGQGQEGCLRTSEWGQECKRHALWKRSACTLTWSGHSPYPFAHTLAGWGQPDVCEACILHARRNTAHRT